MLIPIGNNVSNFRADNKTIDKKTGEYKDPLMNWPLRGAAFTNEVGEALRPIIGEYATLSWAPALMYIGADIYDKYKNEREEYSPDSARCLKQAIFQGMASIFLPLVAVKTGQNLFAQLGRFGEDKVSLNIKEHVSKTATNFIANGKMSAYSGKDEECVKEFLNNVSNSIDYKHKKKSLANFFRIFNQEKRDRINTYAENTIRDLILLRKNILQPTKNFKENAWFLSYESSIKSGQTESVAVKSVLSKFQKNKMVKGNFIKTIGGFVALGIAIKPIDNFVEEVLIGKYLGPGIDRFERIKHIEQNTNSSNKRIHI